MKNNNSHHLLTRAGVAGSIPHQKITLTSSPIEKLSSPTRAHPCPGGVRRCAQTRGEEDPQEEVQIRAQGIVSPNAEASSASTVPQSGREEMRQSAQIHSQGALHANSAREMRRVAGESAQENPKEGMPHETGGKVQKDTQESSQANSA